MKKQIIRGLTYPTLSSACLALGRDYLADCQIQIFSSAYIDNSTTLELLARSYERNGLFRQRLCFLHIDCARLLGEADGAEILRSVPKVFKGCFSVTHLTVTSYHLALSTPLDARRAYESGLWRMMKLLGILINPPHVVIERCVLHPAQMYHLFGALPPQLQSLTIRDTRDQPMLIDLPSIDPTILYVNHLVLDHTTWSVLGMLQFHTRHGSLGTVCLSRCIPCATETSFSFHVVHLWETGNGPREITWHVPILELTWAIEDLMHDFRDLVVHLERLTLVVEGRTDWKLVWDASSMHFTELGGARIKVESRSDWQRGEGLIRMLDVARCLSYEMELEVAIYDCFSGYSITVL